MEDAWHLFAKTSTSLRLCDVSWCVLFATISLSSCGAHCNTCYGKIAPESLSDLTKFIVTETYCANKPQPNLLKIVKSAEKMVLG